MFLQLHPVAPKRLEIHFEQAAKNKQQIQIKSIRLDCADHSHSTTESTVEKRIICEYWQLPPYLSSKAKASH